MENQHRKIKGYRELSQEEIDLMNRIKAKGAELLALADELAGRLDTDEETKRLAARRSVDGHKSLADVPYNEHSGATDECHEYRRFESAEPMVWAADGKLAIKKGVMSLVRAVAQPEGV